MGDGGGRWEYAHLYMGDYSEEFGWGERDRGAASSAVGEEGAERDEGAAVSPAAEGEGERDRGARSPVGEDLRDGGDSTPGEHPGSVADAGEPTFHVHEGDGMLEARVNVGRGGVRVLIPPGEPPKSGWPLVIALHGRCQSPEQLDASLALSRLAQGREAREGAGATEPFVLALPEGRRSMIFFACRVWQATEACCGERPGALAPAAENDAAYIGTLARSLVSSPSLHVDPERVSLLGSSNGGFLANVVACAQAGLTASIATLGASTYARREECRPERPVRMLAVHGTRDVTVPYAGGTIPGGDFVPSWVPGADEVAARWGEYNGCSSAPSLSAGEPLPGAGRLVSWEVEVTAYGSCDAGGASELWAVQGAQHLTQYSSVMTQRVLGFLLAAPELAGPGAGSGDAGGGAGPPGRGGAQE